MHVKLDFLIRIFLRPQDKIGLVQRKYKSETGESMGKPEKKLKKIILIMGMTGAVYGSFRFLLPLVIPFLLSWGLAVMLRPSAQWIASRLRLKVRGRERGIPVGLVGVTELLIILVQLCVILYLCGWRLCAEAGLLVDRIPVWIGELDVWLTGICHRLEAGLCLKENCLVLLMREMLKGLMRSMKDAAMPYLMVNSVSVFRWGIEATVVLVVILVSTGLALQEMGRWKKRCCMSLFQEEFTLIGRRISIVINAYLKTQLIIMTLTSVICVTGFWFLKNPYYILAGIGVGILDALPLFGTGTVLIPWAIFLLFRKEWLDGGVLIGIYLVCYFLREILEAKLMGEQVGLSPLENLIAMYAGLKLFGITGFLLGPVGLLLIEDLVEAWMPKGEG